MQSVDVLAPALHAFISPLSLMKLPSRTARATAGIFRYLDELVARMFVIYQPACCKREKLDRRRFIIFSHLDR